MPDIDFNIHKIFVEGTTDQGLIQFILEEKFDQEFENDAAINTAIVDCKGWKNLGDKLKLFDTTKRVEEGGINLIIFDADSKQNHGGAEKRKQELLGVTSGIKVKCEIFLFPDDGHDGDLEDFYCSCFKNEMLFFNTCWDGMINCFRTNSANLNLKIPKAAEKVFSYVDLFEAYKTDSYRNSKSKRNYFDKGLWNFDFDSNPNLVKLLSFVNKLNGAV